MKNWYIPSRLEEEGRTRKKMILEGFGRDQLRERLGMKKHELKSRTCLRCEKSFESSGDRMCSKCKGGK